jgi:deazaflavin-dependent oxidoreductase (nitroreductase family)
MPSPPPGPPPGSLRLKAVNRLTALNVWLYRRTKGRIGGAIGNNKPIAQLDHIGAKSGAERTTPLVYTRDGDDVILVGSQGGAPKTPSWVFNLRANPRTTIQIGRKKFEVVAREAADEERERLWPMLVANYADFAVYQERTERKIPVIILTPS